MSSSFRRKEKKDGEFYKQREKKGWTNVELVAICSNRLPEKQ